MKLYKLMLLFGLCVGLTFSTNHKLFAQDDDDDDDDQGQMEEMDEEEWQKQMDDYNAQKTQLQQKLDALNKEIDDLKATSANKDKDLEKCEADMYALVGTTKSGVADFRKKFEETEKKINSKTGTPADARKAYFDDITNDKARCLPEFADRYASMKKKLADWEGMKAPEGTYTVVKGDCLWKISKMKYNSPYYWPAIWEANKNGVVNADQLKHKSHKKVTNPNLIYPGQVLKIPTLTDAQKKEAEMKSKKYRKTRKVKKEGEMKEEKKEEKKDMKKETKKDEKKDMKKETKKDEKKDMKKETKKDEKKDIKK
jgi:LysM repeat protein